MELGPACRLESARLVLEPLRAEHADELAQVLADRALHRFIGGEPPSAAVLRSRFERQAVGYSPDGRQCWLNWLVRERSSGRAVGTLQATIAGDVGSVVAELAWVIGTAEQGRGLAKEAAGAVKTWLRSQRVCRLHAHIHPDHEASIAVARSLGMRPTDVVIDGEQRWESGAARGRPRPGGTPAAP